MNQVYAKLQNCYECVRKKTDFVPKVAIVLGSGLGDYAEQIRVVTEIPYAEIKGFPVSTVPGHAGKFIFGYLDEIPVVCMKGRVHYYEGYDVTDVVLPTRLMKLLGAEILFLTNAAGGVNTSFHAGDLMLIRDHISVFAPNPLIGANMDELGLRFPDSIAGVFLFALYTVFQIPGYYKYGSIKGRVFMYIPVAGFLVTLLLLHSVVLVLFVFQYVRYRHGYFSAEICWSNFSEIIF